MKKIYAIGDIHGMLEHLVNALDAIAKDSVDDESVDVIFLGDYIDRGPDSQKVIQILMGGPLNPKQTWHFLKGNHEDMMLKSLRQSDDWPGYYELSHNDWVHSWLQNGGKETLHSYAHPYSSQISNTLIPEKHIEWLKSLPTSIETDKYIFVHAGLKPNVPIDRQTDNDKIWIRYDFLHSDYDFGKHVVHGHTPVLEPECWENRTNLDTGACFGNIPLIGEDQRYGKLTIGVFDDTIGGRTGKFIQVTK
jgi:serine/threonine protein phosphatase 1